MAGIVDAAVVTEVVEEATVRIDAARVVERHRVGDVRTQERGSCCTSSSEGIAANAPLRVTASAPTAAPKRSVAVIASGSLQKAAKPAPAPPRSSRPTSTPPTKASPAAVVSTVATRKLGDWRAQLRERPVGTGVGVRYLRDGRQMDTRLVLADRVAERWPAQ
ncbi:hypothetical protein G6F50_014284 [Rhizopus delemar]|uniref:Uncharacterized protein n=1 Tax=Rhizopus delemar TaxID=936053 RepID=A0A9P6Y7A9_9FUNG|nr:hypothetical protein G6F50_014284 [Rhizopus delemar]